jgi:hypothetical protein
MDLKGEEVTDPVSVEGAYQWHKMKGIQTTGEGIDAMMDTGIKYAIEEHKDKLTMVCFCMTVPAEKDGEHYYVLGIRTSDTTLYKTKKYRLRKATKTNKTIVRFCSTNTETALSIPQGFEDLGYIPHKDLPELAFKKD